MTLNELRYLVALAREKHFGKAAKICHVSQPTLSIAIQKLENKLGIHLIERHLHDIRITPIGQRIVAQAQRTLEEVSRIREIANHEQSQLNSTLKIGGIYTVAPYLFPLLIPKINKRAPQMPLIIQEDFTTQLHQKLQSGELDAAFIALPFKGLGIVTKALYDESFVVLMRKDHPLSQKKNLCSHELSDHPVLLLGEGHCLRDQILEHCPHCYRPDGLQQTIEGTSLETLRHMVASGLGITVLPSSATQVKHYNRLLCVKPFKDQTPKRSIALAWRASFPRTKAIDVIIAAISDCALNGVCLTSVSNSC